MNKSKLANHLRTLKACKRCPQMHKPVVTGGPVMSKVILVGQAPGVKEPLLGRPFAWTAGPLAPYPGPIAYCPGQLASCDPPFASSLSYFAKGAPDFANSPPVFASAPGD